MWRRGPTILYLGDTAIAWLGVWVEAVEATEEAMASQASETWIPRCPKCGNGTLVLAPANGFTKFLVAKTEVYCTNCQYRDVLADHIKEIYIRS